MNAGTRILPTQGSMLEGEHHNILDPFDGHRKRVPWEAFANDDLDSTNVIAGIPMVLVQQLTSEQGKLERLKLALFGHL